jgi:pimeloyl-ACP methyl ester carboxylesterase
MTSRSYYYFLYLKGLAFLMLTLLVSCGKEEQEESISLISGQINGTNIFSSNQHVATTANITLSFDAALRPDGFESAFQFNTSAIPPELVFIYSNQSTRVEIAMELEPGIDYEVTIASGISIGSQNQQLEEPLIFSFRTAEDMDTITSGDPCTSATNDCLHTYTFDDGTEEGDFEFFANYPIYLDNASWENLTSAIIVIHGVNRNHNDYFSWAGNAIRSIDQEENTILIAPQFKTEAESQGNDLFWSGNEWREGQPSVDPFNISSFAVIDSLLARLSDREHFPVLEKVILTGHSSGGLFTHAYAAANHAEEIVSFEVEYIVANSQYFYYPDGQRVDENSGQLYTPGNCTGYSFWPLGYDFAPEYVAQLSLESINQQFAERSVHYLLGNGSGADGSLNTADCSATLLGSTRYKRGENMYAYMQERFPGHNHKKVIVEGIGHDGQGMYGSSEFMSLLQELLR